MKKSFAGLLLSFLLVFASTANAAFLLDDWTIDLTGIDGLGSVVVNDIGQITFLGMTHNQVVVDGGDPGPSAGDQSVVDGFLAATQFIDTGGGVIFGTGLNGTYQMTFDFSLDGLSTGLSGGVQTFTHLAPDNTDGLLDIWIDGPDGGVTVASNSTGLNFTDGVKIATFEIVAGDGGSFSLLTWDGSDDATFNLVWAMSGVFFDKDGNDLSLSPYADNLLVYTDSNYDANPGNLDPDGFRIGGAGNLYPTIQDTWTGPYNGYGTYYSWYAEEDGSARLAVVPEPSTFLLLGAGLFGLGIISRKRMRK